MPPSRREKGKARSNPDAQEQPIWAALCIEYDGTRPKQSKRVVAMDKAAHALAFRLSVGDPIQGSPEHDVAIDDFMATHGAQVWGPTYRKQHLIPGATLEYGTYEDRKKIETLIRELIDKRAHNLVFQGKRPKEPRDDSYILSRSPTAIGDYDPAQFKRNTRSNAEQYNTAPETESGESIQETIEANPLERGVSEAQAAIRTSIQLPESGSNDNAFKVPSIPKRIQTARRTHPPINPLHLRKQPAQPRERSITIGREESGPSGTTSEPLSDIGVLPPDHSGVESETLTPLPPSPVLGLSSAAQAYNRQRRNSRTDSCLPSPASVHEPNTSFVDFAFEGTPSPDAGDSSGLPAWPTVERGRESAEVEIENTAMPTPMVTPLKASHRPPSIYPATRQTTVGSTGSSDGGDDRNIDRPSDHMSELRAAVAVMVPEEFGTPPSRAAFTSPDDVTRPESPHTSLPSDTEAGPSTDHRLSGKRKRNEEQSESPLKRRSRDPTRSREQSQQTDRINPRDTLSSDYEVEANVAIVNTEQQSSPRPLYRSPYRPVTLYQSPYRPEIGFDLHIANGSYLHCCLSLSECGQIPTVEAFFSNISHMLRHATSGREVDGVEVYYGDKVMNGKKGAFISSVGHKMGFNDMIQHLAGELNPDDTGKVRLLTKVYLKDG